MQEVPAPCLAVSADNIGAYYRSVQTNHRNGEKPVCSIMPYKLIIFITDTAELYAQISAQDTRGGGGGYLLHEMVKLPDILIPRDQLLCCHSISK